MRTIPHLATISKPQICFHRQVPFQVQLKLTVRELGDWIYLLLCGHGPRAYAQLVLTFSSVAKFQDTPFV